MSPWSQGPALTKARLLSLSGAASTMLMVSSRREMSTLWADETCPVRGRGARWPYWEGRALLITGGDLFGMLAGLSESRTGLPGRRQDGEAGVFAAFMASVT